MKITKFSNEPKSLIGSRRYEKKTDFCLTLIEVYFTFIVSPVVTKANILSRSGIRCRRHFIVLYSQASCMTNQWISRLPGASVHCVCVCACRLNIGQNNGLGRSFLWKFQNFSVYLCVCNWTFLRIFFLNILRLVLFENVMAQSETVLKRHRQCVVQSWELFWKKKIDILIKFFDCFMGTVNRKLYENGFIRRWK